MSTLATADLGSDDEDTDFVPQVPKAKAGAKRTRSGSQSDSDSDDNDDDAEPEDDIAAKLRQEAADAAAEARKKRAAEAFRAMQAEAVAPKVASASAEDKSKEEEMVEIRRPRRFAGETIYETVKLRKDDPEAVRYLALQGAADDASVAATAGSGSEAPTPVAALSASPAPAGESPSVSASAASPATASVPAASSASTSAPPRRAVRKRPRQSLEAMSAALDKGKKMTTLEKMDWNSHMATETALADEVAQHRRGGGYLEKQAFLDRVGERRENAGSSAGQGRRR